MLTLTFTGYNESTVACIILNDQNAFPILFSETRQDTHVDLEFDIDSSI